ncbi:unnamed protein product [Sphenostylis stenocarpa]|uniref:Uncharacterized protein n=1 Tax=Sphenostylis stenocarpa TaxID=92480 RepID=A0AA86V6E1_9FABA|nr:unnamed protein product [Sphenostylis stenocarpa]
MRRKRRNEKNRSKEKRLYRLLPAAKSLHLKQNALDASKLVNHLQGLKPRGFNVKDSDQNRTSSRNKIPGYYQDGRVSGRLHM